MKCKQLILCIYSINRLFHNKDVYKLESDLHLLGIVESQKAIIGVVTQHLWLCGCYKKKKKSQFSHLLI